VRLRALASGLAFSLHLPFSSSSSFSFFTPAVIYLATFIISVLYWSFDEVRQGRFSSGRGQPQQPATQSKFGTTKYGAVVQT